jgi:hypothetical protein
MSELIFPRTIYLRERTGGGGYPTGRLSVEWESEYHTGYVAYERCDMKDKDASDATAARLAGLLRMTRGFVEDHYSTNAEGLLPDIDAALADFDKERTP